MDDGTEPERSAGGSRASTPAEIGERANESVVGTPAPTFAVWTEHETQSLADLERLSGNERDVMG
jgi:hypothetical protein